MSLDAGRARLFSSWKTLQEHWEETKYRWQDVARKDFDEEYWQALAPRVVTALAAIDRLSQVIHQARQDCR